MNASGDAWKAGLRRAAAALLTVAAAATAFADERPKIVAAVDPDVAAHLAAAHVKFFEAGRTSSELASRILFSRRVVFEATGRRAEDLVPFAALLADAKDSRDPLVLGLLLDRCRSDGIDECDALDLARRWVAADPDGVLPWIALATMLDAAGDGAGSTVAWDRATRAPALHDHDLPRLRAALAVTPTVSDPVERHWDLVYLGFFEATIGTYWRRDLERACARPAHRTQCVAIASTIARDAGRLGTLQFANRLLVGGGAPETSIARHERTASAVLATWSSYGRTPEIDGAADGDGGWLRSNARAERVLAIGEIAVVREELAAMQVTEEEQIDRVRQRIDAARRSGE